MISKAQIKFIHSLQLKKNRLETGLFIAEGIKIVQELFHSLTYQIHSIYYTDEAMLQKDMKHCPSYHITEKELAQISTLNTPNKVLAVVHMKPNEMPVLQSNERYLALDEIKDPGNLGTIIRSADWFGIQTILCSNTCVEYTNPKVIMSSMGSFMRVNVHYVDLEQLLKANHELNVLGASLNGEDLYRSELPETGILLIGSESHGISDNLLQLVTQKIKIPSFGGAESLNASIANAIILSEWKRQYYGRA